MPVRTPRSTAALLCLSALIATAFSGCSGLGSMSDASVEADSDIRTVSANDDDLKPPGRRGGLFTREDEIERNEIATSEWMQMGRSDFEQAVKLAEQKKYAEAEKLLKKLARQDRYRDAFVREEAIYTLAEVQFQQRKYAQADDSFHQLFKEFPSSRYTDKSVRTLLEIAKVWLKIETPDGSGDIQQVNYDNVAASPAPKDDRRLPISSTWALVPNMFDRTRPVFDTEGRAMKTLRSIWMQDPTGPLADDALMIAGTHYYRMQDYEQADRYYKIVRDEYPKSEYVQTAFVMGGHVQLLSYQGAGHVAKPLEDAEKLRKSTLALYPDSADATRIRGELSEIDRIKAKRAWEKIQLYRRKNRPKAIAMQSVLLIQNHPRSPEAGQARALLREIPRETITEAGLTNAVAQALGTPAPVRRPSPQRTYDAPSTPRPESELRPVPKNAPPLLPLNPAVDF